MDWALENVYQEKLSKSFIKCPKICWKIVYTYPKFTESVLKMFYKNVEN